MIGTVGEQETGKPAQEVLLDDMYIISRPMYVNSTAILNQHCRKINIFTDI